MEANFFLKKVKRVISQRNLLLCLVIFLSICLWKVSSAFQSKDEHVVIIPPVGTEFWVGKNSMSLEYLRRMGVFLSAFLVDRSALDINWKNEKILEHVHFSSRKAIKKQLSEEEFAAKHKGEAFQFIRETSLANLENLTFKLCGIQRTYLPRSKKASLLKEERVAYTLFFAFEEGRLFIRSIKKELIPC